MKDFFRLATCIPLVVVVVSALAYLLPIPTTATTDLFVATPSALTTSVTVAVLPQSGRSVTLAWDDDVNPPELTRYYVYHSMTTGVYSPTDRRDAGANKTFEWTDLPFGTSYFVVTAYTTQEPVLESGYSNEVSVGIAVPTLTLNCPSITTGTVNNGFNSTFTSAGGVPPYTFSITSGILPPGLILDPSSGAVVGTPTAAGTYSVTAQVVDSYPSTPATANCTFTIKPATPSNLRITTGPIVNVIDRKTVQIAWGTSIPATSVITYQRGRGGALPVTAEDVALITDHNMTLANLQPNQIWTYTVTSMDADGNTVTANGAFSTSR
jgi:hypothetical protein